MDIPDFLLKVGGLAGTLGLTYLAFVKHRIDSRASEASNENQLLDNYNKVVDRLTAQDDRMAIMRSQLNQQADINAAHERTGKAQADEIAQLNRAAVRHSNEMERANKNADDYKGKWEKAVEEISGCRSVIGKTLEELAVAMRRIDHLEAELRRLGGLADTGENGARVEQIIEDAKALTDASAADTDAPKKEDAP